MSQTDELIIQHTLNWIRLFVIQLNICPFAKREVNRGTLKIQVSRAQTLQEALEALMVEVQRLDHESSIETTFLVFPKLFEDFFITWILWMQLRPAYLKTTMKESIN